ncbi:MAG: hypothetical protein KF742_10550 [Cryobacterium sp.]|uniref:hypothetical protein n=1 Tax=Chelatococcus sp. TaxID=1953771 RepID=UPI001EC9F5C6|nr:hypothetical protein [Chelatococcus sp.]MBX3088923.1 hypothetical protein [Cryobacterium sp.]MBX3547459.1 hypothetical protein [Chelatococcus sp.]
MSEMTYADFSKRCARLAALAASWAADSLDMEGKVQSSDVFRFTDEVRKRLDWIDELAGRKNPTHG